MQNKNRINAAESGFANPALIALIILIVCAIGVSAFGVISSQKSVWDTNSDRLSDVTADKEKLEEIMIKEVEVQQLDDKPIEVATPSSVSPAEQMPDVSNSVTASMGKSSSKKKYVSFEEVSGKFKDGKLTATATLPQAYSGKCKLYMTKGDTAYKKPVEIINSNTCEISISYSELPESGEWEWFMYFWTVDKLRNASSAGVTQKF